MSKSLKVDAEATRTVKKKYRGSKLEEEKKDRKHYRGQGNHLTGLANVKWQGLGGEAR